MNPFLQNFKLALVKVYETYHETKTSNIETDGHVSKFRTITESYYMEQQEKTNFYKIPYAKNVFFRELGSAGRDILLYILCTIKLNQDTVELHHIKLTKEIDISKSTLYNGIQQLIDIGVICKKFKSDYWVNPLYIFKGDRVAFYTTQCGEDCIEVVATINKDANGIKSTKNKKDDLNT